MTNQTTEGEPRDLLTVLQELREAMHASTMAGYDCGAQTVREVTGLADRETAAKALEGWQQATRAASTLHAEAVNIVLRNGVARLTKSEPVSA